MTITIWLSLTRSQYQPWLTITYSKLQSTSAILEWIACFKFTRYLRNSKQRFTSRGSIVTHLTTQEDRETNDLLSQASCFSDLYRPTSDNFVPSVEKGNQFFNQVHHEETVIMDTTPISQSHLSATSSNSYQGSSTPVAVSPPLQSFQFNGDTSFQRASIFIPVNIFLSQ